MTGTTQATGTTILGQPSGSPTISNVQITPTDTTIVASFSTPGVASPSLGCGDTLGNYSQHVSVDSGENTAPSHIQGVAGLSPSTLYYCLITVVNPSGTATATFSTTTRATPASVPITGLVLGTPTSYNSINASNQGDGDTEYNCPSTDGIYMVADDNDGFRINGVPSWATGDGGSQAFMKVLSESPLTIQTIQFFPKYGDHGTVESDNNASRLFGLFCMQGKIFASEGRQGTLIGGSFGQQDGNILMTADHGKTWSNPQSIGDFSTKPPNPLSYSMFPGSPSTMAACTFLKLGAADDGTLGYTIPANEHDNGNLFAYLYCTKNVWNGGGSAGGGDVLYLARVPRAKMYRLSGPDYQYWKGGACNADGSWSSNQADEIPVLTNAGKLGVPEVVHVPAKNRILLLTFYYPSGTNPPGGNTLDSVWLGYDGQDPCGGPSGFTQIFSQEFSGAHGGAYDPTILSDTLFTGTTPTVLWTGNFPGPDYSLFFATLTIN